MSALIWSYDLKSGEMVRVPDSVARSRGVTRDLDDFDCPVEIEFRRVAEAPAYIWQPPTYPKKREAP